MKKAISKKRDFSKITVNGQPLEVLSVLDIEVPVWRDPEKGEVWVFMRPVVEQLGLDWWSQLRKIRADEVLCKGVVKMTTPSTGGEQQSVFLRRPEFVGWLVSFRPSKARQEFRERLISFKSEAVDALDRYFSEGVAVNKRLLQEAPQTAPQIAQNFSRQVGEALSEERRVELLARLLDYLGENYRERLARVLVAKLTGDSFFLPAPQDLPVDLTTWARDRLSREGISLPYEKLRSFAQGMGQRAAHLYKAHFGEPPEKRTQEIGGVVRAINAYYLPQHESILEEAFRKTLQDWRTKKKL